MDKSIVAFARVLARVFLGVAIGLFLQACASNASSVVPRSSVGKIQQVNSGTVVATRTVVIDGEAGYVGYSSGAIVGSAIGQTVGDGSGRVLASAGGAVVGGIVGGMVQKELSKKTAQELTISMDDGKTVVVVQEKRGVGFTDGDRVNVTHSVYGDAHVSYTSYESDGLY